MQNSYKSCPQCGQFGFPDQPFCQWCGFSYFNRSPIRPNAKRPRAFLIAALCLACFAAGVGITIALRPQSSQPKYVDLKGGYIYRRLTPPSDGRPYNPPHIPRQETPQEAITRTYGR
jgi:hypothetical protein